MNKAPRILISILATILAVSICQAQEKKVEPVVDASLGKTKNVHKAGNLFFAGQFTPDDIALIKEADIKRVITLRTDGEIDWQEEKAIKSAGMEFMKIPFRSPETLTDEVFDEIRKALKDKSKPTLFHCGSANRVGGTWLPFRVLDEGVDLETALKEAKMIGLRTEFIKKKAIDYIKRKQRDDLPTDEQSVKPGINKGFKDPDLSVDQMLRRFEVESREIYFARERIVDACELKPGDVVADVGAGTGLFSRMFSNAVGSSGWVFAVDIAPRLVGHIINEAANTELKNLTGVVCADNNIGLPPHSVDLVFVCDTYHHFEYPKSSLASIHKALRPGGRLFVIDFERIEGKTREWLMDHVRAGKDVFRAEIQDASFSFVEEKKIQGLAENYCLVFRKDG